MVELQLAVEFVKANGTAVEHSRLSRLLQEQEDTSDALYQIAETQAPDGGFVPFWAESSALDSTCFRLAQLEQLGATREQTPVARALQFILQRQKGDGSWEEDERFADVAPPWCMPGDLSAQLYLTANCAYWLTFFETAPDNILRAVDFLAGHVGADGRLLSFFHTHWLTAGVLHATWNHAKANQILSYLYSRVGELDASNLAWLINALSGLGVPNDHQLLEQARVVLKSNQEPDGRWHSEDGAEQDVHTTLEAIRALQAGK